MISHPIDVRPAPPPPPPPLAPIGARTAWLGRSGAAARGSPSSAPAGRAMPVRHSLLASLPTASVEPVDMPPPVIDAAPGTVPSGAAAASSSGHPQPARLKKCETAVTLQVGVERGGRDAWG